MACCDSVTGITPVLLDMLARSALVRWMLSVDRGVRHPRLFGTVDLLLSMLSVPTRLLAFDLPESFPFVNSVVGIAQICFLG